MSSLKPTANAQDKPTKSKSKGKSKKEEPDADGSKKKRKRSEEAPATEDNEANHRSKRKKLVENKQQKGDLTPSKTPEQHSKPNPKASAAVPEQVEVSDEQADDDTDDPNDVEVVMETSEADLPTKPVKLLPLTEVDRAHPPPM